MARSRMRVVIAAIRWGDVITMRNDERELGKLKDI
jgi:ribosomal protein S28E/S33